MATIVSAFVGEINKISSYDIYYSYSKYLLSSKCPKIIFVDNEMYKIIIEHNEYIEENTKLIKYNKNDIYFYEEGYSKKIDKFNLHSDNADKNTIDYLFIQCNKTEWIKLAIQINPFNTEQFIWVDFGIYKIFNCNNGLDFSKKIENLSLKKYNNIRIGSIWDLNINYNTYNNKIVAWYFAGGVFGGNKEKLLKFAEIMKEQCIKYIESNKTFTWEVNIWYLIYLKNKDLFDPYKCDHNNSLVDNY